MTLLPVGAGALAVFVAGYALYSRFVARHFGLDASRPTPAHEQSDGVDFVPAKAPVLLAQHFSAISAAGPIAGPILAGLFYGWAPALAWILLGCVLVGAAHDFATLVASVRHRARSVAEILRERLGRRAGVLYLSFVWIALVYVTVAFTDLTAAEFVKPRWGGGVASSSALYLGLAVVVGVVMSRMRVPLVPLTVVSLAALLGIIWIGPRMPLVLPAALAGDHPRRAWDVLILVYCFAAALLPMGVLLQPRGYLGGFLLYGFLAVGVLGLLLSGAEVRYPAFIAERVAGDPAPKMGAPLLPFLFVTIACGACSGFHGLVCCGTTSRQLDRETDARAVGYGAMLLEGLIAIISLACVMVLARGGAPRNATTGAVETDLAFAQGIARFAGVLGVSEDMGVAFGLLALTTFVYDTLDVCTRLGRYVLQELTGLKGRGGAVAATFLTLLPALAFLLATPEDAYLKVWGAFGTSNQLLAALTLMAVAVWLRAEGKATWFVVLPALFLLGITGWSLAWSVLRIQDAPAVGGISIALLLIALVLTVDCARAYLRPRAAPTGA
jgi:carbon starvation protein